MRRKEREREKKSLKIIGVWIIAIMFLGSTIGFVFYYANNQREEGITEFNGYKFVQVSQGWQTNTPLGTITLPNLPQETLNVECDCQDLTYDSLRAQKAYIIAALPEETNAAIEILRNIPFTNVQRACLPENADIEDCKDLPLKGCEDASSQIRVLIFNKGEGKNEDEGMSKLSKEKAIFKNGCLTLEGENLIKAADKVIYKAYGVISD